PAIRRAWQRRDWKLPAVGRKLSDEVLFSWFSCYKRLLFTAKKPPEDDSGNQSGEPIKPFTLSTPHWKLALHARPLGRFPHAGRWLNEAESAARGRTQDPLIAPAP